jgi:hypothetical protein
MMVCSSIERCIRVHGNEYNVLVGVHMYFFVRALNPRPTFHLDMTEEERSIMNRHVAYCSESKAAIVFGPVLDPKGVYGIGVYQVQDEEEMHELIENDPATELLKFEILPMATAVVGSNYS